MGADQAKLPLPDTRPPLARASDIKCPSPSSWATLQAIAYYVHRRDPARPCYPSTQALARRSHNDVRTVYRNIQQLEHAGILSVYRGLDELFAAGFERPSNGKITRQQSFYLIRFDPCHTVTGDTVSPVTGSRSTSDTESPAPVTQDHATGDTVSPGTVQEQGSEQGRNNELTSDAVNSVPVDELIDAWNATAADLGLPTVRRVTEKRRRAARARLKEHPLNDAQAALARIRGSRFLRGGGPRGWKADIDWFLKPNSITKLIEGSYDDERPGAAAVAATPGKYDQVMAEARRDSRDD